MRLQEILRQMTALEYVHEHMNFRSNPHEMCKNAL
jgi:hypothetical protein